MFSSTKTNKQTVEQNTFENIYKDVEPGDDDEDDKKKEKKKEGEKKKEVENNKIQWFIFLLKVGGRGGGVENIFFVFSTSIRI